MSTKEFAQYTKDRAYIRQKHVCAHCGEKLEVDAGSAHFKKPAELGGDNALQNCVILCQRCHLDYGHVGKWSKFVITQDYPHFDAGGMPH